MNYTQLSQVIQDYTETTESLFVANIPVFVKQAEYRIYNDAQIPALRKTATGVLTATNQYLDCPSDYLSTYSFAVIDVNGAYGFLLNKDVSFIREAYPIPTYTGFPKHYAINGTQVANPDELRFILGPTPDLAYTYELNYNHYPESIVTANTTWLGDNYDPVLFYGAMREAVIFQKGEADMVKYYDTMYKEGVAQLKRLGDGLERGDAYRSGQTLLPYNKL